MMFDYLYLVRMQARLPLVRADMAMTDCIKAVDQLVSFPAFCPSTPAYIDDAILNL